MAGSAMAGEGTFLRVLPASDLPEGKGRAVAVAGEEVLLVRSGGRIHAVQNLCTHQRAKLEGGRVRHGHISCPLHGMLFDLATGAPKGSLSRIPLKVYPVRVVDDWIEVQIG